jgi:hypothetical protein
MYKGNKEISQMIIEMEMDQMIKERKERVRNKKEIYLIVRDKIMNNNI